MAAKDAEEFTDGQVVDICGVLYRFTKRGSYGKLRPLPKEWRGVVDVVVRRPEPPGNTCNAPQISLD